MSLSHMQLTAASDEEMPYLAAPTPRRSHRRGLGLAVTVVGLVCIVGATWPNTKRVTARQHFGKFRDAIVQAFDDSVLADQPSMVTSLEIEFGEEGAEEPDAMEISAKIQIDDDPQEKFVLEHTFLAEEGKGEDLKTALDNVLVALKPMMLDEDGNDNSDMVTMTQTGDEVVVAVDLPQAPKQLSEGLKKPVELDASFKFGRDLDSLYTNMNDNAIVAWHGLHFKLDAKFKGLIAAAVAEEVGGDSRWGLGLSSLGGKLGLRYKTPDELGDLFDRVPTMQTLFEDLQQKIGSLLSPSVTELLLQFKGVLDGWKTTEIRGLPESYKITVNYDNFKPSKLLVKMIDELQPAEDFAEDPAEDPA